MTTAVLTSGEQVICGGCGLLVDGHWCYCPSCGAQHRIHPSATPQLLETLREFVRLDEKNKLQQGREINSVVHAAITAIARAEGRA